MPNSKKPSFEKKIKLRPLTLRDYDAVREMQQTCFPNMKPWSLEQFESVLTVFPEGQLCIRYDGKIVASCCSLIIKQDDYPEDSTWNEITDNGFFRNHNPMGDTLYAAEIMVAPEFRGMKLARRLYEARQQLAQRLNLEGISAGGRVPGYHKHANKMSIYQYVQRVVDKKIYDPVLTTQLANGFVLKRILPDYIPKDTESCGYATFLEWSNLQYVERDHKKPPTSYVRVAAVQYQMRYIKNYKEFASNCEYFVDVASDYRCDFILFPEMLTLQLLSFLTEKRPAKAVRQLNVFTDQYVATFTSLAINYNINIIGGTHFVVENDELYNVAYLFRRNGTVEKQYKLHITPNEKKWWGVKPGNEINVFNTDRGRVAISICYDIEFPEISRIIKSKGAEIVFVPFNTDERRSYLRVRYCAQARAVENLFYVAMAGCVGNLPRVENMDIHFAQSAMFTPCDFEYSREGIATEAPVNVETIIFQDLDLNLLKRHREFGSVQTWNDRRTDLYSITHTENGKVITI